jgi:hypothetical protein
MVPIIWTVYCLSSGGIFAPCVPVETSSREVCESLIVSLTQNGSLHFGENVKPMCWPKTISPSP